MFFLGVIVSRGLRSVLGHLLGFTLALSLVACGKEEKNNGPKVTGAQDPVVVGQLEDQLRRQTVDCENGQACPEGIAKIAVVEHMAGGHDRLRFCTGFLLNSIILGTSASCLTEMLRASTDDRTCQADVHIFFPRTGFREAKRVACSRLLLVTALEGKDPVLWRNDLAYIEMAEPISRRYMKMSRDGITDNSNLTLWKVDAENDQVGVIRKSECTGVLNTYVNPLSQTPYDPNFIISGCALKSGNKGAPILNGKGQWQGVYSGPLDSDMMMFVNNSGYLTEPLRSLGHVSNTVCLPALRDDNPVTREECSKDLDYSQLDRARASFLGSPLSHEGARVGFEKAASALKPYLNWKVELVPDGDTIGSFRTKLSPRCFKPVSSWIRNFSQIPGKLTYSFTVPDWKLKLGLDGATHFASKVDDRYKRVINVEFSPSAVNSNARSSYVSVWSGNVTNTYRNVTESCQ